jgi:hypothetical protein
MVKSREKRDLFNRTPRKCPDRITSFQGNEKETLKMDKRAWFNKETFLRTAEGAGLKPGDPHLEELYAYVQNVLPGLQVIEELDLKDVEPMSSPGVQERSR